MSDKSLIFIYKQQLLFFFLHVLYACSLFMYLNEKGIHIDGTIRNGSCGNDQLRHRPFFAISLQVPVSNHQVLNYHVTIDQQPKSLFPECFRNIHIPKVYSVVTRQGPGFIVLLYICEYIYIYICCYYFYNITSGLTLTKWS